MYSTPATPNHPGYDAGIDLAARSGDVVLGHERHEHAATGCDSFGGPPLVIAAVMDDHTLAVLYRFGWRWSAARRRMVCGWWTDAADPVCESVFDLGPIGGSATEEAAAEPRAVRFRRPRD